HRQIMKRRQPIRPRRDERPRTAPGGVFDEGQRRILAAAAEAFGQLGYHKTTIQDIVLGAGVSRPLFYGRLRDKQHVCEVVVDELITEWNESVVDAVSRARGGTAAALRALHEVSLRYGRAHPLLHRLLTRDTQLLLSTRTDVIERGTDALRGVIREI